MAAPAFAPPAKLTFLPEPARPPAKLRLRPCEPKLFTEVRAGEGDICDVLDYAAAISNGFTPFFYGGIVYAILLPAVLLASRFYYVDMLLWFGDWKFLF